MRSLSNESLELIADRFKVLSEPIRLRILKALEQEEKSVQEITEIVETSQPNISKHLRLMQDSGLLERRQEKNSVYYRIADPTIFDLCDTVCGSLEKRARSQANLLALT